MGRHYRHDNNGKLQWRVDRSTSKEQGQWSDFPFCTSSLTGPQLQYCTLQGQPICQILSCLFQARRSADKVNQTTPNGGSPARSQIHSDNLESKISTTTPYWQRKYIPRHEPKSQCSQRRTAAPVEAHLQRKALMTFLRH